MSNIIHQIAQCADCGEKWEDYVNGKARKQARAHAKKTGHYVFGETGTGWSYNARKKIITPTNHMKTSTP